MAWRDQQIQALYSGDRRKSDFLLLIPGQLNPIQATTTIGDLETFRCQYYPNGLFRNTEAKLFPYQLLLSFITYLRNFQMSILVKMDCSETRKPSYFPYQLLLSFIAYLLFDLSWYRTFIIKLRHSIDLAKSGKVWGHDFQYCTSGQFKKFVLSCVTAWSQGRPSRGNQEWSVLFCYQFGLP